MEKLLKEVYKTYEGARKRAAFENGVAKGEFQRGDKAKHYYYALVPQSNGTYRVSRQIKEAVGKTMAYVSYETALRDCLLDFQVMAENELLRLQTGKAPGPAMRDVLGQWKAFCVAARQLRNREDCPQYSYRKE